MNFTGTESGTAVSRPTGTVFFGFTRAQIENLLGRNGALGIRLHFDKARPTKPTELYAAACDSRNDIMDSDLTARRDYFKSDGSAVQRSSLPDIITSAAMPKANTCVYFSKNLLRDEFLNKPGISVTQLRFFVVEAGTPPDSSPRFFSLVVTGLDQNSQEVGSILQSSAPCPPDCPDGYP